jgi:hypothetical protein
MDRVMMRPGNKSQKFMNDSILNFDSRGIATGNIPEEMRRINRYVENLKQNLEF